MAKAFQQVVWIGAIGSRLHVAERAIPCRVVEILMSRTPPPASQATKIAKPEPGTGGNALETTSYHCTVRAPSARSVLPTTSLPQILKEGSWRGESYGRLSADSKRTF
jgi:hypothetical protein